MFKIVKIYFLIYTFCAYSQSGVVVKNNVLNDSVVYYLDIANYNKEEKNALSNAIFFTEKAVEFSKKNNLDFELAQSYLQLGGIYSDMQKNSQATEYLIKSINLFSKYKPSPQLAYAYYNLGKNYQEKNNIDLAEIYYSRSNQIYNKLNITDARELIDLQKAIIEKDNKRYEKAKEILLNIANSSEDNIFGTKAESNFQLGEIAFLKENYIVAINYYENALSYKSTIDYNWKLKRNILKQLSNSFKRINNLEKSNDYLVLYTKLSDSLNAQFSSIATENTFDRLAFEKQLKTIENMAKEKDIQTKSLKLSKLINWLSIALLVLFSLFTYYIFRNYKLKLANAKLLEEKNNELIIAKERAEKATQARSNFLSTVSHELRTPLNAITGITYLLMKEKPKEEQLEYLKSLQFSGNYLLNFINDILEINRLESDKIVIEKLNFNLYDLLYNICNSFKEMVSENNINLTLDINDTKTFIIADSVKISQILINLINNAIKFSKNENVLLSVKKTNETEKEIEFYFEVKDTGIGISKEKQKSIFDSFSQGSIEINRKYGGTGLGLSIVKKIIELLNGNINLKSELGKGSTFWFSLIFEKGMPTKNEINTLDIEKKPIENKKVLLVEDNKINQMITQKMLENKKISCYTLETGEEAIEHLKNNFYDLVLMDVHLPGINGTDATLEIRKFNKEIPIVALTAISLNENKQDILSFGINEVLTKPFEPEKFYEIVVKYLL